MGQKIAILGGGITGMTAAHFLHQFGHDVVVIEKNEFAGGNIQSITKGGFTCEAGPNTVLINNQSIALLLKDLHLLDRIVSPDPAAHKNRFILKDGAMVAVPTSVKGFIGTPLLSLGNKLRLLKEPFVSPHDPNANPTLESFVCKRFGKQFYRHFIVPFVTGIYAGDPSKMSAKYAMKLLYEAEQEGGSVFRGMIKRVRRQKKMQQEVTLPKQKMFTLNQGLQQLPQLMAAGLKDGFINNAEVMGVQRLDQTYEIQYRRSGQLEAIRTDQVISTLPAHVLSPLLDPNEKTLRTGLENIDYVPASVVHLGFEKKAVGNQVPGFGVLSLPDEDCHFLGVLFNSRTFPHTAPDHLELFTMIIGGSRAPELTRLPETELMNLAIGEISSLLDISSPPVFQSLVTWHKGIPQYDLEHGSLREAVADFEGRHPGFHVKGNFVGGLSVSDCIQNGHELAMAINKSA